MLPHIDDPSESSSIAYPRTAEESTRQDRGQLTIETLPEEILLEIFAFYMCNVKIKYKWKTLVHVCWRWRSIIFAAPCRLDLRVVCRGRTPAREMLDIWPAPLIAVRFDGFSDKSNDNILAALEKHDRICEVTIKNASAGVIKELAGAMRVTFPALTVLDVHLVEGAASIPESFLGGSTPNLRSLDLTRISFPALPKLLLSSPGLVTLSLSEIPPSGYISFDAIVDCLSSLTRLKFLQIGFPPSQPPPDLASRRPTTLTRTFFPVLRSLSLEGVTEYLDQILAHIEAPLLDYVDIRFFNPPIFDISRIFQCICRTETFDSFHRAHMFFCYDRFYVLLSSRKRPTNAKMLMLSLLWTESNWELRELTLDSFDYLFGLFSIFDREGPERPSWENEAGSVPWLHLVRLFTTMEHMYLTRGVAEHVAPVLQGLTGERVTAVLPVLQNIFVERLYSLGSVQEALEQFVAARRLVSASGHYIDVQCWARVH